MKQICLYLSAHQPLRLRTYRFFDMGVNHNYYDDFLNKSLLKKTISNCYLPVNNMLLNLIEEYGDKVKISLSISGLLLEQLKWSSPETIESFKKLVDTGNVEIISEPYNNSLNSLLENKNLFKQSIKKQNKLLKDLFNVKPKVFKNTELLFSDDIADVVEELGFEAQIIEGAKHVLGWKSPDFLYCSGKNPRLKLLNRNSNLSDDIAFRFTDSNWDQYPLTAEKYLHWLNVNFNNDKGEFVLLGMEYEVLGNIHTVNSGIQEFFKYFIINIAKSQDTKLVTPSEILSTSNPTGQLFIPDPITWSDEEKDINSWLGNDLQKDAFEKLFVLADKVSKSNDDEIIKDFNFLQDANNWLFMCTKLFSAQNKRMIDSPYDTPYNAYINFMNVVSDLAIRVNESKNTKKSSKK
ncbi:MAG: glycoside hydrolase family 57 protein [Bacteroidales bacterium]|jgi:alpha-amylase